MPWKSMFAAAVLLGVGALIISIKQPHVPILSKVGVLGRAIESNKNPLKGKQLYVDPNSNAARQAAAWRTERPADAAAMDKLAAQPTAEWVGVQSELESLRTFVQTANAQGDMPVTVAYNIPGRDCGMYSAGGAEGEDHYKVFIDGYARAIGDADAVVILEPDALAQVTSDQHQGESCLNHDAQASRYELLNYAVKVFEALPATVVYIDAGNSGWIVDANEVAGRLEAAGIDKAHGFSLNVSNFRTIEESTDYGKKISDQLDGKHFVIDTSRNGVGPFENHNQPAFNWCNPPDRALGHYPTVETSNPLVDAYLYLKSPGESDGTDPDPTKCFGGPQAGTWQPEYALGLIRRWPNELQPRQ